MSGVGIVLKEGSLRIPYHKLREQVKMRSCVLDFLDETYQSLWFQVATAP